ncbi:MAG TPA: lysylphosphatidylglycerol synthase domain-containing protein [Beijerinckiaceae bacterium]
MSAPAVPDERRQTRKSGGARKAVTIGLAVFGVGLAAFLLYRTLSRYTWDQLKESVAAVPTGHLLAALGFAAASYLCLTFFDYFASRYAGKPMPWRRAAHASFISLSLGHNIGLAALSSGAIRYRFYSRWGMNAEEVTRHVLFCGATVGLGLVSLAGVVLAAWPASATPMLGMGEGAARGLGLVALAACGLWVACAAFFRAPLRIRAWSFRFPPLRLALIQIPLGFVNFALVAACLHQALSASAQVGYAAVVSAYVAAQAATLVSHVPGGLGVIETVVAYLIPGGELIGALLVFRFVYFLLPLALGLVAFLVTEAWWRRGKAA